MASISGPMSTRKTGLLYLIVLLLIMGGGGLMFTGGMQLPTNKAPWVPVPDPASQQTVSSIASASAQLSIFPTQ